MTLADGAGLLSELWSPLVVVTAAHEGRRGGQIAVSAFAASIVPEKPRLLLEVQKRNHTHALIEASGRFAVHLLPRERWRWVRRFGFVSQAEIDKFAGPFPDEGQDQPAWREGPHGLPLLEGMIGWLACRVVNAMDGGDMTVYLAEVEEAERSRPEPPVHWREVRPYLPPGWVEEYGRKLSHDVPDSSRRMESIDRSGWGGPGPLP